MKATIAGVLALAALVVVAVAGAAPPVVASPGASPFASCNNADYANEQQQQGSTLYPNSEIEPRSARHGTTIVGAYQQDR